LPAVEPDGFEVWTRWQRIPTPTLSHSANVSELDIFVFTLGLTEGWVDRVSGAICHLRRVYPAAFGILQSLSSRISESLK
jgi:hypothetical protein